jgi:hypothetical protein
MNPIIEPDCLGAFPVRIPGLASCAESAVLFQAVKSNRNIELMKELFTEATNLPIDLELMTAFRIAVSHAFEKTMEDMGIPVDFNNVDTMTAVLKKSAVPCEKLYNAREGIYDYIDSVHLFPCEAPTDFIDSFLRQAQGSNPEYIIEQQVVAEASALAQPAEHVEPITQRKEQLIAYLNGIIMLLHENDPFMKGDILSSLTGRETLAKALKGHDHLLKDPDIRSLVNQIMPGTFNDRESFIGSLLFSFFRQPNLEPKNIDELLDRIGRHMSSHNRPSMG